jgi:hypothetical protein
VYQLDGEYYTYDWEDRFVPDYPPTSEYFGGTSNVFYGGMLPPPSWVPHSIVVDPLFWDPDAGDFRLKPTSPAVGRGTPSAPEFGALPVR